MVARNLFTASTAAIALTVGSISQAQQTGAEAERARIDALVAGLAEQCAGGAETAAGVDCAMITAAQDAPDLRAEVAELAGASAAAEADVASSPDVASGDAAPADVAEDVVPTPPAPEIVEAPEAATAAPEEPAQDAPAAAAPNGEASAGDAAPDSATDDTTAEAEVSPAPTDGVAETPADEGALPEAADTQPAANNTAIGEVPDAAALEEALQAQQDAEEPASAGAIDNTAETPTEPQPEAPRADAADSQTPASGPEAPADAAPQDEVDAQALEDALRAEQQAAEPESNAEPVTEDAAPAPEPQASMSEAQPEEAAEAQAQAEADAAAELETQAPAAAAASGDQAEAEVTEDTVAEGEVRRSDEDFSTSVTATTPPAAANTNTAKAEDDDDDDDRRIDPVIAGALVGFGALALNEILKGDEQVVTNSGDRVVVEDNNGRYRILRDDDVLLRRPGSDVTTYRYDDGSTRNVVVYDNGTTVETIRANDGRVLRRVRTLADGQEVVLFDDTQQAQAVVVNDLPQVSNTRPRTNLRDTTDADSLARALAATQAEGVTRSFSLTQIRNIKAVRQLVPEITVDTINFETNSAAIRPDEARDLAALGNAMRQAIAQNPSEVFLIEGHTDAVGRAPYNLALSDRRAESVALALTEYFDVPPENMVLQGYGEGDLLIRTEEAARENRRAAVRRITPLLQGSN
ncbi:OmpA family protein [Sagittula sp. SSi028]|uniref:OmpA family protein n=1 Tax=Sagittula sp. SSi028 TaxID=3400636 RepID=UPI003AF9D0BF